MTKAIPFFSLQAMHSQLESEMASAFRTVYQSGHFVMGDQLCDFEAAYASYSGSRYCVGVSNGLDALYLALMSINIGPGDEVLLPANTFVATALAIVRTGATPVFVDASIDTYNIDTDLLITHITDKTRAIIPVHLYGRPCDMERIAKIATDFKLRIVEDNAQAQGALTNMGLKTGALGKVNATSFYPTKNLGALGDGGAITTNDPEIANNLRSLRSYGSNTKYIHNKKGFNMRLDELQAAFLLKKLQYLDEWNSIRQNIASMYTERLANTDSLVLPQHDPQSVYHHYVIRVEDRISLQRYLKQEGVGTLIHYPVPLHLQECFSELGHSQGDFPVSELIAETCLSLPIYPGLKKEQVVKITDLIRAYYG